MNPEKLGAFLRKKREQKNMTQMDVAKKLGYESVQFVSLFERGLSKVPFQKIGELGVILSFPTTPIIKSMTADFKAELETEIYGGSMKQLHTGESREQKNN